MKLTKFLTISMGFNTAGFLLFASLYATPIWAADAQHGKEIYSAHCGGCHDTKIHTRPNRIVHTYEDIVNRVKFCDTATKSHMSETEILDVAEYLNDNFYKFLKPKN